MRPPGILGTLVAAGLLLAGCGGASRPSSSPGSSSSPSTSASSSPSTSASSNPGASGVPSAPRPARPRVGQVVHGSVVERRGTTTVDVTLTKVTFVPRSDFQDFAGRPVLFFRYRATNTGSTTLSGPDPISYRFNTLSSNGQWAQPRLYYPGSALSPQGCVTAPDGRFAPGSTVRGCAANVLPAGTTYSSFAFLSGDMTRPSVATYRKD